MLTGVWKTSILVPFNGLPFYTCKIKSNERNLTNQRTHSSSHPTHQPKNSCRKRIGSGSRRSREVRGQRQCLQKRASTCDSMHPQLQASPWFCQHESTQIVVRRRRPSRIQSKRNAELNVFGGLGVEGHGEGSGWCEDTSGASYTSDDTEGGMGGKRKEKEDRNK